MKVYIAHRSNIELDEPAEIIAVATTFARAKQALIDACEGEIEEDEDDYTFADLAVPGDTIQDSTGLLTFGIDEKEVLE